MTRRKKIGLGAALALVIVVIAAIALGSGRQRGVEVRVEVVERRDLVSLVTASGQIQARRKVDISADISGRVIQVAVEEGQWVDRGALLLRIDPTSFQAAVRSAEAAVAQARAAASRERANLEQARSGLQRAERLASSEQMLISESDLEQARTQASVAAAQYEAAQFAVAQAQAQLSEAREQLRKTTIAAPMSGRVTRVNIEEGETAMIGTMNVPGSLLLTVSDLGEMEARVKVDETEIPRISLGDSASVRIDAYPGQRFAGRVRRIAESSAQPTAASTGTAGGAATAQSIDFEVYVTLLDPPADLRPDLSATADIVTATVENVLSIPILALTVRDAQDVSGTNGTAAGRDGGEVEGVFIVRDGHAHFTPVEVGITGERYFQVVRGLDGGETIVAGTYQAIRDLRDGAAVRLRNGEPTGGGAQAQQP